MQCLLNIGRPVIGKYTGLKLPFVSGLHAGSQANSAELSASLSDGVVAVQAYLTAVGL